MDPAALVIAYISFWSIAVVGGYLVVVGLGNLRYHRVVSRPPDAPSSFASLRGGLRLVWDVFLLLLGTVLAVSAMVFLYLTVYG